MAVSVKPLKKVAKHVVVAVRTVPPVGIERTTDFIKADSDKPFDCVEIDGIAVYQVYRKGVVRYSYPAPTVISVRTSTRPFRTKKVTFVRRLERTK